MGRLLDDALRDAKELAPSLIDIGTQGAAEKDGSIPGVGDVSKDKKKGCGERELHISLSRPTYLRAHQREDLKRAIKAVAKAHAPYVHGISMRYESNSPGAVRFKASFATFSELMNDEKTRTFLTLEVGAGHNEVSHSSVRHILEVLVLNYQVVSSSHRSPHPCSPRYPSARILFGSTLSRVHWLGSS